jgi:transcription-repair coupling factor (superfamily II helicase)
MSLRPLPRLLAEDPAIAAVLGRRDAVLAVPEPARAVTLAALATTAGRRPLVVGVPTGADAERLAGDLAVYLGPDAVALFPAWETLPFERVSPSIEVMARRCEVLWQLRDPARAPRVVVAPARSLIQRLAPGAGEHEPIVVGQGDTIDLDDLVARLASFGYRREYQVEHRGEFAVRGSIVDVFPATADAPVRIDLWGDEVDRLGEFAVADQRSTRARSEVVVHPCRELRLDGDEGETLRARAAELVAEEPWGREHWERLAEGLVFDGMESWVPWLVGHGEGDDPGDDTGSVVLDRVGADALVVLIEPRRFRDRAAEILAEEADLARTLAKTWDAGVDALHALHVPFDRLLARCDAPAWTMTNVPERPDVATVIAAGWAPAVGDAEPLMAQLRDVLGQGYRVVVAAEGAGSSGRILQLLRDHGVRLEMADPDDPVVAAPGARVVVAPLERGFLLPSVQLAVLTEHELTGRRRTHRRPRPRKRESAGFFENLHPGDYVVHHQHGVARFGGMVKRAIGGVERDYLLLEYRGDDKLYVPSDQIDAVRPYSGGDSPSLSRMGGGDWQKAKARVRAAVQEVAQELVVLYQKRVHARGHAFGQDTPWQTELEQSFPYQETPDQLRAIEEIKSDMESEAPMDRLVCGDVGFGKTEVALRAAFKAIQDGKQVALLVPTTLLASQHFQTFSDRFAPYPVRVELLSRFLTAAQARTVAEGLATGEVDLVVGTHRLLSGDVAFKDLGLLIVDEEQRFGVSAKEAIKQMKADVDVLTLSATPIPRTLEMSLTGIRDLSLLNTPPADRQPILTYVGEYDERAVAEAIRRELLREGQVFFVHNRVQDIEHCAARLRELVPEARIAIAHGQMDEGSLEQVVVEFWEGHHDVLVCTTIIESGIDMPTVNTLVVDRADRLGLGQLHQLRGRVGRAGMRAYAYLFHPADRVLSEEAYERLRTIGEATELGSGFRIAMRDLEIRGAGNLLGEGQSGHIAAVGYDLYCEMVTEAVAELKGEEIRPPAEIKIDVPVPAHLPTEYVEKEEQRMEAYRRLASVTRDDEVDDIRREWEDRFGPVPEAAEALLRVARLRAACASRGITEVVVQKGPGFGGPAWNAKVAPVELPTSKRLRLERLYKKAVLKEQLRELHLPLVKGDPAELLLAALEEIVPVRLEAAAETPAGP